jgi:MoxR-like ATPase
MLVRAAQARALTDARDFLSPDDVQVVAADVLAHRMVISGDATARSFVDEMLRKVGVP